MENRRTTSRSAFFATTAIVCFSYGALALLTMHVLRPEYASHMVSDYAVGPHGWVMTSCFLAMSIGCLMLLLGLLRSGPVSRLTRIGAFLLGMASIGLLISAIFPTDVKRPVTHSGYIHFISFLVNVGSIFLAAVFLSVSIGRDQRWRTYQRIAVSMTSLIVLAFLVQFLTILWRTYYALANRFFITVVLAWLFAVSILLRVVARSSMRKQGRGQQTHAV